LFSSSSAANTVVLARQAITHRSRSFFMFPQLSEMMTLSGRETTGIFLGIDATDSKGFG
jgi:hypothetical protein